nr:NADH dehydrogenase subunit 6 [Pseudempusa pinnapavonis]
MMNLLLKASLMLKMFFLFLNHPLSMGFILLLQTLNLCLISGFMSMSFWFSYILLLIYLGGMLVLFMYVTSLASNEMFFYSNKILLIFFLFPIIFSVIYLLNFNLTLNLCESMDNYMNLNLLSNNFLLKMYNQPINMIMILIASYLFLTLIAVVKIINIFKGPLRQMN